MIKQFQFNAFNAKGNALAKEMSVDFDKFTADMKKKYLLDDREYSLMLGKLEEAWLFALKGLSRRPDTKA